MYTFQDLIRKYSDDVSKGFADPDLTPRERRLTQILLNIASNSGFATVKYPPTEDDRNAVIKRFGDIMWDSAARSLVTAASPSSDQAFSNAIDRTVRVIRNM
jgi:hypothetical protein